MGNGIQIYHRIHKKENRYIVFDSDVKIPYIYFENEGIPVKLHLFNDGILVSEELLHYADRNKYKLAYELIKNGSKYDIANMDIIEDIDIFKIHIKDILEKILEYNYTEKCIYNMCDKLSVLIQNI